MVKNFGSKLILRDKSRILGGVLHIKPKSGFKLNTLEKLLEDSYLTDDTVAAYASKVAPDERTRLIQVVFAEDNYTGRSVEVAREFFKQLTTSTIVLLLFF